MFSLFIVCLWHHEQGRNNLCLNSIWRTCKRNERRENTETKLLMNCLSSKLDLIYSAHKVLPMIRHEIVSYLYEKTTRIWYGFCFPTVVFCMCRSRIDAHSQQTINYPWLTIFTVLKIAIISVYAIYTSYAQAH